MPWIMFDRLSCRNPTPAAHTPRKKRERNRYCASGAATVVLCVAIAWGSRLGEGALQTARVSNVDPWPRLSSTTQRLISVDLLLQFARASAAEWAARASADAQELVDLESTLSSAHPERHPLLVEPGPAAFISGSPGERNSLAVDVLLNGFLHTDMTDHAPAER